GYYEHATKIKPTWSMDALDVMYAHKRLAEIKLFEKNFRSFRTFERQRRRFSRVTDRNLTNVSSPILNMDMLENPEKYKLNSPPTAEQLQTAQLFQLIYYIN